MISPQRGYWEGAEFLFDYPLGSRQRTDSLSGYLFSARRFTLEVASLTCDTTWLAGHSAARVRLSGLARFQSGPLKVSGPGAGEVAELESTWLRIQASSERRERMDYSSLSVSTPQQTGRLGLQSELLLFVEPAKLVDLIRHLETSSSSLRVQFLLETEEGVSLSAGERRTSVPVYDVVFSLQQAALDSRTVQTPMLPQLRHALKNCVPGPVSGTSQLEAIGEEIALGLSHAAMIRTRGIETEFHARNELLHWLIDIRTTMHRHAYRESDPWRNVYSLSADEFELEMTNLESAERFRLQKAYGRVWTHSPIRVSRRQMLLQPELDQYDLAPEPMMLEDLACRYVDDDRISSATLEWCLANALLRQDTVALGRTPTRLLPKLRAAGMEICVQSAFAGCAWVFAAGNALVFWMVFLALNLLRWISPTMSPALAKKSSRSTLLAEMRALHDKLSASEFDAAQLLLALQDLVARGAPVRPVLLRLAEKSARRQDSQMRPA